SDILKKNNVDISENDGETPEEETEPEPLGWDFIDRIFKKIYKNTEPLHYGNISPFGEKKLKGISVYDVKGENPHWHFVTYGLSELYEKESDNLEKSGYGIELTFRLVKEERETEVPNWAINFLNNLANYIFKTGNVFNEGHYLNTNGSIAVNSNTNLKAVVFFKDAGLNKVYESPNGSLKFLQITGITHDELEAVIAWNTEKVTGLLGLPLNITYLNRDSGITEEILEKVELGIETDGSSTGFLYVDKAELEIEFRYIFRLGALGAVSLRNLLRGVVLKGKVLTLYSKYKITFQMSFENRIEKKEYGYDIYFTKETAVEIADKIEPKEDMIILESFEGFDVIIEKSYVKDRYGKIVEVVG
ncbi:MAG: suppressor of fused domain protein, partial [Fusobacteriales bacterium]|nr:suppressor of fused domain protein [Fusobacteriales bacterium]